MKRLSILILSLAAMAFMMTLSSCTEGTGPVDTQSVEQSSQLPDLMVADASYNEADMTNCTLDQDMAVVPPMDRKMKMMPFGRIIKALNLTEDQVAAVRLAMQAHKDCMDQAMEALRLAEKAILDAAKVRRDEIIAAVRAGSMTKEEARTALQALNQRTREAMKNLPEREAAQAAVKNCNDTLFAAIRALLTADQQVKWDEWVAKMGDMMGNNGRGKGHGMGGRP